MVNKNLVRDVLVSRNKNYTNFLKQLNDGTINLVLFTTKFFSA